MSDGERQVAGWMTADRNGGMSDNGRKEGSMQISIQQKGEAAASPRPG